MRRVHVLAVVGVMALLGAACSDEDDRLTQDEFLEQGNEICAEGNAEADALAEGFTTEEPSPDEMDAFVDELVPIIQGQIDDLEALSPPEDIEDDVDQMLADAQDAVDEIEAAGAEIFEGDDPFVEVNEQAAEIGLTACAEDGDGEEGNGEGEVDEAAVADIVPDPDDPYCAIEAEIDSQFEAGSSELPPDATEEEQLDAFQALTQDLIDSGLVDEALSLAPDQIAEDVQVLASAVEATASGDFEAFESPEAATAAARVDAFCGVAG